MPIAFEAPTQTVTIEDVFLALKKNGFQHLRGEWITYDLEKGAPIGGCVLQQAAFNLNTISSNDVETHFEAENPRGNLLDALNEFTVEDPNLLAPKSDDDRVGAQIIIWNDSYVGEDGKVQRDAEGNPEFLLKTYDEVVDKAYQILKPLFAKKIELPYYEY